MSAGDFQIKVTGDFSDYLRGLGQLPAAAQQAGDGIAKGLDEPIKDSSKSLAALQNELRALKAAQAKLPLDSSEYRAAGAEVDKLKAQITALASKTTKLPVDASDAPAAANQFRLLDGVVQGIAFSLSNALTDGASRAIGAIGNVVGEFGRLDTEIRKAAAAGGEPGGYDKLARAVDQVGIEAAGTSLEVAQLATELVRGGMSVDDANASLGAIVRGAEATGTSFASMGSVVSAAIKGFGLEADDANRVVDALVQGANASAASVEGMGMAFKYAAPVAKIMGVSVEELGVAIGLMTNAGISAEEAGTTLRNGLSKLAAAAPQTGEGVSELTGQAKMAADTMRSLGVDIYETDGTLKPMEQTLLQLKGAFEKLDPSSKIRLAANLFGGEDDGAKWLALLNQSEEEIKRMSAAMANTKGATDTARDAMQGFELGVKQLEGTLGSIQLTFGEVAATALLPLVNIANTAAGVVSGLPEPVKQIGAALILLAGGATVATAGIVAFNMALATTQVQSTISSITAFAGAMKVILAGAATQAIVSLSALKAALIALTTTQFTFAGIGAAIQAGIVAAANAGTLAFGKLTAAITSGALVAGIKAFAASAGAALVAMAPLALAVGAVAAAVATWQYVLGGAQKVTDEFAGSQKAVSEALVVMAADLDKTAEKAKQAQFDFLGLGKIFRDAREGWTLMALVDETKKLEQGFDQLFTSAMQFFKELKDSEEVTEAQRKQAENYIKQLEKVAAAYRQQAEAAKVAAVEAARVGNADEAKFREAQARSLGSNAKALENLVVGYQKELGVLPATTSATQAKTAATQVDTEAQSRAAEATKARAQAEAELNKIIATAPVRNLEAQITLGQQLVSLSQALADREQSRFAVTKAGLEFELAQAEKRGASEAQIGAIKKQIQELDRQALQARFQALKQEQQLQVKMLELSQQKARLEADLSVQEQRAEILKAQVELQKAQASGSQAEIAAASAQVELQQAILGIKTQQQNTLKQTQPIEAAILGLQQETAINGERAKAAQMGYRFEANGSLVAVNALAGAADRVGVVTANSATEQARLTSVAQQTGLAIERAADGSFVLGRNQQDVGNATAALNRQLDGTAAAAGKTATAAGGIGDAVSDASNPAGDIASAFTSTSGTAPKAAQGARDFAGWLSGAKGFATQIAGLPIAQQMADVANRTMQAANAAKVFYDWLERASRLPGSRWTGGPVDAGEQYRVNELGQEALLAGGRLSLINAAPNSLWRAPANGTVIPAGITSRLQEQGALPGRAGAALPMGGGGSNAALAVEVGKLRQEVGELARKQWNVNITTKTGPTGSQVLKQMLR